MSATTAQPLRIALPDARHVSGLLLAPPAAGACFVLAHGAGAGMTHAFMAAIAEGLAECGIATLRYQFFYMEEGGRRPDPPKLAHGVVRAAVAEAARQLPGIPLFAGGKSFGGRMTSQAQAAAPLSGVRGIIFIGFPLHPPERPSTERAQHLSDVRLPMLFLQGTRDKLAEVTLLAPLCAELGARATLQLVEHADHAFHVLARSGRNDAEVRTQLLNTMADWIRGVIERS
jgi:uncharacterized protein